MPVLLGLVIPHPKTRRNADKVAALGQANAAESLLKTLPTEIIDASNEGEDNEQQEHEHDHYQHLFGVFASFELVEEVLSRAPKST